MTGARLMAALECANDAGGRCALWPSGDAHACYGVSHDTATSCAFAAGSVSAARAALTGTGATPQSKGLVRVRTQVCFHTSAPVPSGSLPIQSIPTREGGSAPLRGGGSPVRRPAGRLAAGITEQGRGTPDGSGHSPSRQVRDAPVLGDRGATAKQPAIIRHRPPAIGGPVPPPESLSVAAAENDLQSWLRTRESLKHPARRVKDWDRPSGLRPRGPNRQPNVHEPAAATGEEAVRTPKFPMRRSCSPSSREESNDGTHETKPAQLRRRRMGPEPGTGLSRSQDRPVPDRVARERAQAQQGR